MQLGALSKRTRLLVVLMGFALLSALFFLIPDNAPLENALASSKKIKKDSELPVRIKIPKIHVDAAIQYVGLTSDGAMDVPKNFTDAAWFNLGPRPGEEGSAAIAGHYGRKNNKGSVFDNLHKLRKGDKIYIENEDGIPIPFVVRKFRTYGQYEDALDVFDSSDGKAHLNLITCNGVWNKVSKTYSKRLVVFTDKLID